MTRALKQNDDKGIAIGWFMVSMNNDFIQYIPIIY